MRINMYKRLYTVYGLTVVMLEILMTFVHHIQCTPGPAIHKYYCDTTSITFIGCYINHILLWRTRTYNHIIDSIVYDII